MPKRSSTRGTNSVIETAANAFGKQVKRSTTTRMSQTWFASQIGPIACSMRSRCSFLRGPVARRSQMPPPKSAPASRA
jgi:hypothetical protein